jgi:hypothetical protein
MDSMLPKDSNDIFFVIFGSVDQKIWFMQDSTKIRSKILIWIGFKPRSDTCQIPIIPYHFVWISNVERRILKDLDVLDWTISVHLSEPIWSTASRSGGYETKREERKDYPFGSGWCWAWPAFRTGPNSSPSALFLFSISFSFLFLVF